jgi:CRP-like cAMP-binding protein
MACEVSGGGGEMEQGEKIRLLKSLKTLDHLSPEQLESLSGVLKLVLLEDGAVVFEEGSPGDSLYFLTSGEVRILKRMPDGLENELTLLGPGDCFGEMALLSEGSVRSARAEVARSCVLFELKRAELAAWLASQPGLAVDFFNGLLQLQSARLRRTSQEATILLALSRILIAKPELSDSLLAGVLDQVMWYLDGPWWGGAFVLNGGPARLAGERGERPVAVKGGRPLSFEPSAERQSGWLDAYCYQAFVPAGAVRAACLMVRSREPVVAAQRHDIERFLAKAVGLLGLAAAKG